MSQNSRPHLQKLFRRLRTILIAVPERPGLMQRLETARSRDVQLEFDFAACRRRHGRG